MLEFMLNRICGPNLFSGIYDTLSVNLFAPGGTFAPALSLAKSVHTVILSIGVMLMVVHFVLSLTDKLSSDTFTWEQLWRQFAMLLASKYLMEHSYELMETFFSIGMTVTSKISALGNTGVDAVAFDAAELINGFRESLGLTGLLSVLGDIILFVYLIIPFLASWIMGLCVNIICYSRVIEIYTRTCFAPIALSDFFRTGLDGAGWRYLKSFLAVCLQGAIILVIGIIYSKLFTCITIDGDDVFGFTGKYLAFYASSIAIMFKSLGLSKELLHVG